MMDNVPSEPAATAPRVVIVVARDRPELHAYFMEAFAGMADVKVILDRRIGEAAHAPPAYEQRGSADIYDELQERGFIITRVW